MFRGTTVDYPQAITKGHQAHTISTHMMKQGGYGLATKEGPRSRDNARQALCVCCSNILQAHHQLKA